MIEFLTADEGDDVDAMVIGVGADRSVADEDRDTWDSVPWLPAHLDHLDFSGKSGQTAVIPFGDGDSHRMLVLVGLGDDPDLEQIRRAAGSAAKALSRVARIGTTLHRRREGAAEAVGLGFVLGSYRFDRYKNDKKPSLIESVTLVGGNDDDLAAVGEGAVIGEAVCRARDLVNEPAIAKSPEEMARLMDEVSREVGIEVEILDEDQIVEERLGGLRGVSLGADNPARMVRMTYAPEGATRSLVFVGKGIVFDSGGLSIKSASNMETMKTDMAGAAAVFAATVAIARLGLDVAVTAITPLTENMPGGGALRPGDVIEIRNGKTIEVLNTDAEGRLVLADGLSLAAEMEPDLIVDLATLTGTCKAALGEKIAGLLGGDDAVAEVSGAAEAAGERVWRLPLPPDYRKKLDSDVADMKNTGGRWGGALTAALLLEEFVGDVPWAHLDIAGPARAEDNEHYTTKGGTGFGVRTLVELARRSQ